ncbi:unnamed protein product [Lactuca virosa]|uniref:Pyrroline-5-carboxylate reductase n=1 Tax=Lactuca virosa TaxID=75947 RepID=A0AAU9N541_9ASTR|nr:unnamed protein product [Lactuca virosa]
MGPNGNVLSYESPSSPAAKSPPNRSSLLQLISKRRTSILLAFLVCAILLSSWNLLNFLLSWYGSVITTSPSSPVWWPAIYASVTMGLIFGVLAMAAALVVAVPATVVIWISVLVLMTFCGKRREWVVEEGRKLTVEMSRTVGMVVIKEGNLVAAVCAVFGYFVLVRYGGVEHGL